jgi:hypothetical protein
MLLRLSLPLAALCSGKAWGIIFTMFQSTDYKKEQVFNNYSETVTHPGPSLFCDVFF